MRKHTYMVLLKEFLKLFKCLSSRSIHTIYRWLDLLFKSLHQEREREREREKKKKKKKKVENSHKACMGTLSFGRSPPIYRYLVCKLCIIMFVSTNIHRPYTCDPLGPYTSLVNNFIDPITHHWSTFINYLYQHIYLLIKD